MSFFINSINPFAFAGQMIAYLGTTDPDGWIICDGTEREWDNKYQSLIDMSIGTRPITSKYKPPDLRDRHLRGKSTDSPTNSVSGDNNNLSVSINNFPDHNHGTSTSSGVTNATTSHTHTYTDYYYSDSGGGNNANDGEAGDGTPGDIRKTWNTSNPTYTDHSVTITSAGTNTNVSISIQNNSYRINWILKY